MSKKLSSQMLREIEELNTVELYRAYHNSVHMEKYHVRIDDNWLRNRLFQGPAVPDELIISSKFTIPMQEIVDGIYACIMKNIKDLENWNVYREDLALSIPLGKVIGYGFVQRPIPPIHSR